MIPYYFLRFSGPLLLVLVGLKILSGYSLVGKIDSLLWISELHESPLLDLSLLFLFIFHSLYGVRLFLIDLGMKGERLLFWISTIAGAFIFGLSYLYLY